MTQTTQTTKKCIAVHWHPAKPSHLLSHEKEKTDEESGSFEAN